MKILLLLIFSIFLVSCNSKIDNKRVVDSNVENIDEFSDTVALTPEEEISNALVLDILDDYEEEDLQSFIEENLISDLKNSDRITIDRLSSSLYILSYNKENVQNNILIQKFYNPKTGEIFFEKSDAGFDIKNYLLKK